MIDGITINHNKQKNGIELKFSEKPAYNVISEIKSMGFRWHTLKKIWYETYSESLWNKVNEKFAGQNNEPQSTNTNAIKETPKLKKQINPQLQDIAGTFYNDFAKNPPATIEFSYGTLTFDPKIKEYTHLPKGRKRPDKYPIFSVHEMAMKECLHADCIIDWDVYYSNPLINMSKYAMNYESFQYIIREYPQQKNAANYIKWNDLWTKQKNEADTKQNYWFDWKNKNLQEGQSVWVSSNGAWEHRNIQLSNFKISNRSNEREDVIQCIKKGYISHIGYYLLENVYSSDPAIDKNAKNLIDTYGTDIPVEKKSEAKQPVRHSLPSLIKYAESNKINVDWQNEESVEKFVKSFKKEELPAGFSIDWIVQQLQYMVNKDKPASELNLETYATVKFIGEARTESLIMTEALYVPVEDYRQRWLKEQPEQKENDNPKKLTKNDIPKIVEKFVPPHQIKAIIGSEEHFDIVKRLETEINNIPKLYACDKAYNKYINENKHNRLSVNDFTKVAAHFFYGNSDWYILEWDKEDTMFGYVILNGDVEMSELGYISLSEIRDTNRIEMDFFWDTNTTLAQALYNYNADYFEKPDIKTKAEPSTDSDKAKKIKIAKAKMKMLAIELELLKLNGLNGDYDKNYFKYGDLVEWNAYNTTYTALFLRYSNMNPQYAKVLGVGENNEKTVYLPDLRLVLDRQNLENKFEISIDEIDNLINEGYLQKSMYFKNGGEFIKDGFWREGSEIQKMAYRELGHALYEKFKKHYKIEWSKDGNILFIEGNLQNAINEIKRIDKLRGIKEKDYSFIKLKKKYSEDNTQPQVETTKESKVAEAQELLRTKGKMFLSALLEALHARRNDKDGLSVKNIEAIAVNLFGSLPDKRIIRELVEIFQLKIAKGKIIDSNHPKEIIQQLWQWYKEMPIYHTKDSNTSIMNQFSTPIFIAYILSLYCLQGKNKDFIKVFEPSGGNGLLASGFNVETLTLNELDPVRVENLKQFTWEGKKYQQIISQDAAKPFIGFDKKFDCVISNPPFYHQNEDSKNVYYGGLKISSLDQVCVLRALDCLKDDGRAAFIIDGNIGSKVYSHHFWNDKGELAGENKNFFNYLYANYFVDDVLFLDGHKIYARQGQATNLRVILISGRRSKPDIDVLPPLYNPETDILQSSPEALYNRVMNPIKAERKAKRSNEAELIGQLHTAFKANDTNRFNEISKELETNFGYKITISKDKIKMVKIPSNVKANKESEIILNEIKHYKHEHTNHK